MIEIISPYSGANFTHSGKNCDATGDFRIENGAIKHIGIAAILGAVATFAWAVYLYKYYQKLDAADKPGVKIEDLKKEGKA